MRRRVPKELIIPFSAVPKSRKLMPSVWLAMRRKTLLASWVPAMLRESRFR